MSNYDLETWYLLPQRQLKTREGKKIESVITKHMRAGEWEWKGSAFHFPREAKNSDFCVKFSDFLVWETNSA